MAANEIELQGRVLHWVENESDFETDNHVIKKGEQIVILDPIRKKIGNGNSTYNELQFDTNHHKFNLEANISTFTLYNVIPQTTFSFRRTNPDVTDVVFLLDSFKDSNRGFSQCDGRMHKIFIENGHTSTFEVEVVLTTQEVSSSSQIIDFGVLSIPANSSLVIEFCWFTNVGGGKVCFCRTSYGTQTPAPSSDSNIWKLISATRVSDTSFTVIGDQTNLFQKGLVIKWIEGSSTKLAMCTASTVSSVTTVTMIGDICSSTANEFKYCILPVEIIRFAVAGTIGMTGTDVANAYYTNHAIKIFGADIQVGTAGTTNSTTIDINKGGTSLFTNKPSLASTVAYSSSPFVADVNTSTATNNKITIDIDAVQSTPAVDLYVQLYVFQTRLLYIN